MKAEFKAGINTTYLFEYIVAALDEHATTKPHPFTSATQMKMKKSDVFTDHVMFTVIFWFPIERLYEIHVDHEYGDYGPLITSMRASIENDAYLASIFDPITLLPQADEPLRVKECKTCLVPLSVDMYIKAVDLATVLGSTIGSAFLKKIEVY